MNRRELLAAVAAISLAPGARALAQSGDLKTAARDAWLFALPLIEMAAARVRMTAGAQRVGDRFQGFAHARKLATPDNHAITTPNNDTLYSNAWVDLSKGPATLTIPAAGERYLSVAVMDMYTDNVAVLGTRTIGGGGGTFKLVGPGQAGGGPDVVRVTTPQAWLLARTLVDGEADLAAAHAVQDGIKLTGAATLAPAFAPRNAAWDAFFAAAADLIGQNPPRAEDRAAFRRMAPLGLTETGGFDPKRFDAAAAAQIEAGIAEAKAALLAGFARGVFIDGWSYPQADLGFFGQDYGYRAAVALGGLAALTPVEAMYMRAQGDNGRGIYTGDGLYRLSLPGKLPVDAFWSLTMYEATADGQFFLTENPINRYAIGDRTPGLKVGADGALDIWIGRRDPGGERTANWLPAPAKGPFALTLRAYLPRREMLTGRYRLPPIVEA